jgi:hypothetical protein
MYISVICAVYFTVLFTSVNAGLLDILRNLSPKLSSGDYKVPISLHNSSFAAISVNSSNANTVSYESFSGWFEWKNVGWWNIDQFFGASNRDTTQSASPMGVSYGRPIENRLSNVFQSANRSANSFSKESNAANPWLSSPSRFIGKCGLAINKIRSERARNSQRTLPIFGLPQIFSKKKYPTSNSFTGTLLPIQSKYKHTWPPAVQKKFGSAVCDALDSQLQDMYRQFQAVRNVATPQHWTLISSTGNSSEASIESNVIRVWKLNYAGIDALLSSQPQIRSKPKVSKSMWNKIYVGTVSDAATTNANLRKTTDPHDDDDGGARKINGDDQAVMGVNTSLEVFKMISRRWPCIKAQCSIPEVTPVQLQKVLWESDSASVLLRPDQSSTFAAVSLEHRYDLVRFDHQTKLVWSRFKFPWSSIVSSSSSSSAATTADSSSTLKGQTKISVPGETKRIDVSGELLSLSHHFYDTATQTYVLLSQSVAPPLAKALLSLHNTAEAASEVDPNAAVLQQAMQQQSQRSHVRLSVTLLSAKGCGGNNSSQHSIGRNVENLPNVNFGDECRGTEMMQVSQTQWQTLPSLLVWQSVGPATVSYLRNVQRFAPKLIGKRFVASNVQNERRDGK